MFPHPVVIKVETLFYSSGGYNGDKNGYEIPAGTDVFLSVSFHYLTFTLLVFSKCQVFVRL